MIGSVRVLLVKHPSLSQPLQRRDDNDYPAPMAETRAA
jgi:hypothetical protein